MSSSNSNPLDNKIKYISTIIDSLGNEENIHYRTTMDYLGNEENNPIKAFYDPGPTKEIKQPLSVNYIKSKWENSIHFDPDDRIKEFLNFLEEFNLRIKYLNIFNSNLLRRALGNWIFNKDFFTNFYGPISNWDTSYVTSMSNLFTGIENFDEDISRWNVSNVTDMSYMFDGATIFNQNIGSWNVSNVTNMSSMFRNAKKFNGDISSWDTKNVRFMESMFEGAESFNQNINTKLIKNSNGQILYTAWDVSNVENLRNIFRGATSFNGFVLDWDLDFNKDYGMGDNNLLNSGLRITLYLVNWAGKHYKIEDLNPFNSVLHLRALLFRNILNEENKLLKRRKKLFEDLDKKILNYVNASNYTNIKYLIDYLSSQELKNISINELINELIENFNEEIKEIDGSNENLENELNQSIQFLENLQKNDLIEKFKFNLEINEELMDLKYEEKRYLERVTNTIRNEIDRVVLELNTRPSIQTNRYWYPKIIIKRKFDYQLSDDREISSYGVKNGDTLSFLLGIHEDPPPQPYSNSRITYFNRFLDRGQEI